MNIYTLFPFIAAALYGLSYTLIERITGAVNLTTYYILSTGVFLSLGIAHGFVKGEAIEFNVLKENPSILGLIILANLAGAIAWMCTTYALKNISASYAAFGEISYPLFTLFFSLIIFGVRSFDVTTVIGGLLILAGSFIMVYGQRASH